MRLRGVAASQRINVRIATRIFQQLVEILRQRREALLVIGFAAESRDLHRERSLEARLEESSSRLEGLLKFLLPLYEREGKAYLTVAIGCTGGRHRSVMLVEALRSFLTGLGLSPIVRHRDLDRE